MKKVLVAMSGGVDSAVASLLLKQEGYDLTGVTMRLWSENESIPDMIECPPDDNALEAKKTAELLSFPHVTTALGESFKSKVIARFIDDYQSGRTPNPCVECNRTLKFGALFSLADKLEIPYLATGHYAKIDREASGEYYLKKAEDAQKDQSYFLWSIDRKRLPFILFPLGSYTKPEIRKIATEHGFNNASRSDSQDICFIPDGDYVSFIEKNTASRKGFEKGSFVDCDGNILGEHNGIVRYTIGQRKGLGIALGRPIFVGGKSSSDNSVLLCSDRELYKKELSATRINLLVNDTLEQPLRVEAKIRYRHSPAPATVIRTSDDKLSLVFDEPQRAICAGQSLVLYDGDVVIGGGIIE
jgi:tRNA-specific 2-thiouridylase